MSAEAIKRLRSESGLTDGQIARLIGVTVRAIHNWASGSTLPPSRAERLKAITDRVFSIPAASPEERRDKLLASSNGPSIFSRLLDEAPRGQVIQYQVPLLERLGA